MGLLCCRWILYQWSYRIEKGVRQGCILSPCLFNLYAECFKQNARLNEAPAGFKISGRNINNLKYEDEVTLMAKGKEELKSFLMKEESGKSWFKTQHSNN